MHKEGTGAPPRERSGINNRLTTRQGGWRDCLLGGGEGNITFQLVKFGALGRSPGPRP